MSKRIISTSDTKRIDSVLKKYWGKGALKHKIKNPKFKILLIYCEEKNGIKGYIYAHDINDGYFHWCILDDISTGEKFDAKIAENLIRKLMQYCKKEKIESIECEITDAKEKELFKKLNFGISEEKKKTASIFFRKNLR